MRKILLTLIPALMLLGSCAGAAPEINNNEPNNNALLDAIVEDTLPHDELFGDIDSVFKKARRNENEDQGDVPVPITATPKIGIQTAVGTDTFSIRFIAATTLDKETLESTDAVWTRTIYDPTGALVDSSPKTSTFAYTALYDGSGKRYTIEEFNAKYGPGYKSFVVYTMTNIPNNENGGYYLNASLSLNNGGTVSDIVSTNLAGTKRVSFGSGWTGFFLKGTIAGRTDSYLSSDNSKKGDNLAAFLGELKENDSFFIVNNDPDHDHFFVYDSTRLATDATTSTYFENNNGKIKVKYNAGFSLYFTQGKTLTCTSSWAPQRSIWLCRNDVWRKHAYLDDNGDELKAENVYLEAGDVFGLKVYDNYIGYTSSGDQGDFIVENGNITVKAGKTGYYNLYVYGEGLVSLSILEKTYDLGGSVTFNITIPSGSAVDISYVGIKYKTKDSGDYKHIATTTYNTETGKWTGQANETLAISSVGNSFQFFVEIYAASFGGGNAEVWSVASPQTALKVSVLDKANPVVVNITPSTAITAKADYIAGTKTGTNCNVD